MKNRALRVICLIIILVLILAGLVPSLLKKHYRSQAAKASSINNMRYLSIAISEFENDYGHFPHPEIPKELLEIYPQQDREDIDYILGQLVAAGSLERKFLASFLKNKVVYISEVGGKKRGPDNHHPSIPILLLGFDPQTGKFDPEIYKGKFLIIKADGSVAGGRINEDGHGYLKGMKPPHHILNPEGEENRLRIHYPLQTR